MRFAAGPATKTKESKQCAEFADVARARCGSMVKPATLHEQDMATIIITMMIIQPVGGHLRAIAGVE